jgi:predicted nucleotidyltransferase
MRPGTLTPDLRLDELLIEHAHALQGAAPSNFAGMYLIGSLAVGQFDATSDVDFMVVTHEELSSDEFAAVQAAHVDYLARDDGWPTHLEYSFFPMAKLQTLSSPFGESSRSPLSDRLLWYFNGRQPERSDHDNTLVTRWTLREKGGYGARPRAGLLRSRGDNRGTSNGDQELDTRLGPRESTDTGMGSWEVRAVVITSLQPLSPILLRPQLLPSASGAQRRSDHVQARGCYVGKGSFGSEVVRAHRFLLAGTLRPSHPCLATSRSRDIPKGHRIFRLRHTPR